MPVSRAITLLIAGCLVCAGCGRDGNPSPMPTFPSSPLPPGTGSPSPVPTFPSAPEIFVGAGDIGWCGSPAPEQTARLLDGIGGTVFVAGDLAYFSGTAQEFRDCYDPSWGRHKNRTRPAPGNHEYVSTGAAPYFDYFGALAGPAGLGYYSFEVGPWHAIALNSLIPVNEGSAQAAWLRDDLANSTRRCTIAYWHYPLFTSGPNWKDGPPMRDIWRILYAAGVEVVVNGHDHLYERFAPQDPDGLPDPERGIREFVAGTGGANLYSFVTVAPNSERRLSVHGVLKLTLQSDSYQWEFVPVPGGAGSDSGTGTCH